MPELSKKQEAFIDEYFKNGFNGTTAYKKVYKVSDLVATASASRLLIKVNVKKAIDERHKQLQQSHIVTREELLKDLAHIKNKQLDAFPPSSLKAIEMLAKMQGWNEPDKVEISGTLQIKTTLPGLDFNNESTD